MKVTFDPESWSEYLGWQQAGAKVLQRINVLIEECRRHPFTGTGRPEPLRQNLAGWWSRRITGEHRLVYRVVDRVRYKRLRSCHAGIIIDALVAYPAKA